MTGSKKKVAGIILGAGSASRMGQPKQLLPFGTTTLLGQVVKTAAASALSQIIVVLGYKAEHIVQHLDLSRADIVINTEYAQGQSTSLIKGLEKVFSDCDAAMFLLGDQPLVTVDIINRLINAHETANALITIPYCDGQRGNPVIIARPLFQNLAALSADTGARAVFDAFKESILPVLISDPAILFDVDTMEDYEHLTMGSNLRLWIQNRSDGSGKP